ncbi:UDP-N-acetylmuramoyl-L-alanyl-D-glutamate--2,6-diaminopimelate ligase [Bacillus sp. H-16]|uniref:UDP-N-acetylmuramoyl-L-alanyl-D-glutamate--2, 6-diaminopimelate ligase n=1 Tax=Alteribacter salitolerans TaxID=2912333 RepID=UPI0019659891|nr:UDP-N-acetylmuramoyl-L-alanyl-D-glutamate--2,6-diaminopimelate ligase [Alteribacter salitolerans]MBM7095869.1 UDP-N-acetylmuramoyl-L-alanyl-D-glutamate--2,6-diaminopimelate ligase [Alteribacter salitolerans]
MNLQSLLECLPSYEYIGNENPDIKSVHMDSREVTKNSLFICVRGFTVDGHSFFNDAVKKGAAALIAEEQLDTDVPVIVVKDSKRAMALLANRFYGYPTMDMNLIGVTGTNGKTTTAHLIEKILTDARKTTGMIGTMYTRFAGVEHPVQNTTPESLPLQKTFSEMKEAGVDTAVMEVSSHALEMGRVHGCHYNVAVFTNLSQDHLDYHETMEKYLHAKGLLFAQLGNGYYPEQKNLAVLNADDEASKDLLKMTAAPVIQYGVNNDAEIKAVDLVFDEGGSRFTVKTPEESAPVRLNMVGKFSVYNALAAIAAVRMSGIPLKDVIASLEDISGVSGRVEKVTTDNDPFTILVDYAHTPDSLENVLETIKEFATGRVFTVVGCGGDRDRTKRPQMARVAEKLSDMVFLTSDNPRSEAPEQILEDMKAGMKNDRYSVIVDRKEAIERAVREAGSRDVILIAGKGHETYQIIAGQTFDFDDRIVAKQALEALTDDKS